MPVEPLILLAAFGAGFIDAIIGGGGLIQLPTLIAVYPNAAPAWLLGTNKCASVFGTASAAARYAKTLPLDRHLLMPAVTLAFSGAFIGAVLVSHISQALFKPLVPVLLLLVLGYTLLQRQLGQSHAPIPRMGRWAVMGGGLFVLAGFYDGFFGPGAGSLLMLLFIRFYGYDFLHAAASARVINMATNIASLLWFGSNGTIGWVIGGAMAVFNVLGALAGTRVALWGGTRWVRIAFIGIVSVLIVKSAFDAWVIWNKAV